MNEMTEKKLYIWKLAAFLTTNGKTMSAQQLVDHLNANGYKTQRGTEHSHGGHGPYSLISQTWRWVKDDLRLPSEAEHISLAYVKPDGTHAWNIE